MILAAPGFVSHQQEVESRGVMWYKKLSTSTLVVAGGFSKKEAA